MKKRYIFLLLMIVLTACHDRSNVPHSASKAQGEKTHTGMILIASDIVTEVIVRPDPDGDPWDLEKVAGYKGEAMINSLFNHIYDGSLKVYDYHSGEEMAAGEVKKIEKEFDNDRSRIGKLSFTEDWYYDPAANSIEKVTKSVVLGFELYNNERKVYAYKAAFKANLGDLPSSSADDHPQ